MGKRKLKQQLKPQIKIQHGGGVSGHEIMLGSIWDDILGHTDTEVDVAGKKDASWEKASKALISMLKRDSDRLDSLKEQLKVEEAMTKRKMVQVKNKQSLTKAKNAQKNAIKKVKKNAK